MKRKNGEGSWSKVDIRGVSYFRYRKTYEGMKNRKTFYGKTQKEVLEKIEKFETSYSPKPLKTIRQKTVYEYCLEYVNSLRPSLTPAGFDGYHNILKTRLKNFSDYDLANMLLSNVQKENAEEYVKSLIEHGYSPKTIKKTIGLIKASFEDAISNKLIDSNPFDRVKLPKVTKPHKTFMSLKQHDLFCETALHKETKTERWNRHVGIGEYSYGIKGLALTVIADTGLRVSELIALTWKRVNLDTKTVQVFENVSVVPARYEDGSIIKDADNHSVYQVIIKDPKTSAGIRTIPMSHRVFSIFSELSSVPHNQNDICFSQDGDYLTKDQLRHTCKCIGKRINLPELTTQNLRHSFGAIMIHQKHLDPQVVSKLLGHSEVATTYEYYSDVISEIMAEAIEVFN